MENIVQVFKALGDENRLKILIILSRRRICGKGIARHLGLSEAAVSQHLKILREADLIYGEKQGYYVHYNLREEKLQELLGFVDYIRGDVRLVKSCYIDTNIPSDCNIACKANKNKCCKRIKED